MLSVSLTQKVSLFQYLYWLLSSYLGAQSTPGGEREKQIYHEWKLSSRQMLTEGDGKGHGPDTLGVALLEEPSYGLPIHRCPDGHYQGPTVSRKA